MQCLSERTKCTRGTAGFHGQWFIVTETHWTVLYTPTDKEPRVPAPSLIADKWSLSPVA